MNPPSGPRRIVFVQFGDYAEAVQRFAAGGKENYYAQKYTVDYMAGLRCSARPTPSQSRRPWSVCERTQSSTARSRSTPERRRKSICPLKWHTLLDLWLQDSSESEAQLASFSLANRSYA